MFEIYTEKARRGIFFARYEASLTGSPFIGTRHLLFGLLRESQETIQPFLNDVLTRDSAFQLFQSANPKSGTPISTSVDLPLSEGSKQALAYAAEESEGLKHKVIGTEHLFLGLLRVGDSTTELLQDFGASVEAVHKRLAETGPATERHPPSGFGTGTARARLTLDPAQVWKVALVAQDGTPVGEILWQNARPPQIGESLEIDRGGSKTRYRILDLHWQIAGSGEVLTQQPFLRVTVREEPAEAH